MSSGFRNLQNCAPDGFHQGCVAFTLVELLMVIGIIAVLAALGFPALNRVRNATDRTEALSKMRQVGMAIQGYTADHDNALPGPLWSGQNPQYKSSDNYTLGYHLWSYLGSPDPQNGPQVAIALSPKSYERFSPDRTVTSFFLNIKIPYEGADINPWGWRPSPSAPFPDPPKRIVNLVSAGLATNWAMEDVDKTSVPSSVGSWYSTLPPKPLYNPYRLKLYFDWHVAAEPIP